MYFKGFNRKTVFAVSGGPSQYSSHQLLTLKCSVCTEQFSKDDFIYSHEKQSKKWHKDKGFYNNLNLKKFIHVKSVLISPAKK